MIKRFFLLRNRRETSPLWLIIFSDMTTNLMLFFLILFAMTRMTATGKELMIEGMGNAVSDELRQVQLKGEKLLKQIKDEEAINNLRNVLMHGKLAGYTKMTVDEDRVNITLNPPHFFATGSAELNPDILTELESLVDPLKRFPNDIVIEGHTDNVPVASGKYRSNWELSIARAVSVINFLTEKGLNPKQLITAGYGKYHPAYPNDTEEHRARNRRIEITIIRKQRL
ncbi:motility protein B [bacterium BMS3Abin07]|nr:motility protein B [bacterium BMS3Abin07]GBE33281.1 motility protein B [bacterium BMS3Bbin05]HDL19817.1 hypothetical protein [Nitrospirota bacterium]HDO22571.1 hypothetical protein [Nitrospirota bacterium]HDZ87453.1 hypothetical protein [Nitrospirota bacterium]